MGILEDRLNTIREGLKNSKSKEDFDKFFDSIKCDTIEERIKWLKWYLDFDVKLLSNYVDNEVFYRDLIAIILGEGEITF